VPALQARRRRRSSPAPRAHLSPRTEESRVAPGAPELAGDRGHRVLKRTPGNVTGPAHVSLKATVQRQIPGSTCRSVALQHQDDAEIQSPRRCSRQTTTQLVAPTAEAEPIVALHPQIVGTQADPLSQTRRMLNRRPPHAEIDGGDQLVHPRSQHDQHTSSPVLDPRAASLGGTPFSSTPPLCAPRRLPQRSARRIRHPARCRCRCPDTRLSRRFCCQC
jgi:hypothetical protein